MPDGSLHQRALLFSVRVATVVDAPLLARLGARLFEQAFGAANDPEDMRAYLSESFSVDHEGDVLADVDRMVWIAEDPERTAIGYAVVRRGSTAEGIAGSNPAEVQRIYVDSAWHGQRVGHVLMRACIDHARQWDCDVLWLGVWERNPRAIAFYERNAFRVVGHQTFALGRDLQQDLVMALPLR